MVFLVKIKVFLFWCLCADKKYGWIHPKCIGSPQCGKKKFRVLYGGVRRMKYFSRKKRYWMWILRHITFEVVRFFALVLVTNFHNARYFQEYGFQIFQCRFRSRLHMRIMSHIGCRLMLNLAFKVVTSSYEEGCTVYKSPVGMGRVRVFRLGGFVHVQSRDEFFFFWHSLILSKLS